MAFTAVSYDDQLRHPISKTQIALVSVCDQNSMSSIFLKSMGWLLD